MLDDDDKKLYVRVSTFEHAPDIQYPVTGFSPFCVVDLPSGILLK